MGDGCGARAASGRLVRVIMVLLVFLVPLVVVAPGLEAAFVESSSLLSGPALEGWGQNGVYSIWDATNQTSQQVRNVARLHLAIGTVAGGGEMASEENPIDYFFFRIDHWATSPTPGSNINWNIQLNLGSVGPRQVDHLLRFRPDSAGDVRVGLLEYHDPADIGAFTTGHVTPLYASKETQHYSPVSGNPPGEVLVNTGSWDGTHYSMEVGVPASWLTSPPNSHIAVDGTGEDYITGAVFSSTGQFHAVGSVQDELQHGDGEVVVVTTNMVTGVTNFHGVRAQSLAFLTQPEDSTAGEAVPPFSVEVLDVDGQRVTVATHPVTLMIEDDPSGGLAVLSGTLTVDAVEGVAVFSDLVIDTPGEGFTLRAQAPGLLPVASGLFDVVEPPDAHIEVDTWPVAADGSFQVGARWGGWVTDPGMSQVQAANYLRVVNTGDVGEFSFTVAFSQAAFAGVEDESWGIPIEGNISFACAETHEDQSPDALEFVFTGVSASGAVTCSFTSGSQQGAGAVYVLYRIEQVPQVALLQEYAASFTVSVGV